MGIKSQLFDEATGNTQFVDEQGAASVTERFSPPFGGVDFIQPIALNFTNTGTPTGSSDMRVNGSVTAAQFSIIADTNTNRASDRYINTIVFSIGDQNTKLRDFGAIPRLTNGCRLFYQSERGTVNIRSGLKSNFDFIRLGAYPGWGLAEQVGLLQTAVGTAANAYDVYMPVLNFSQTFGTRFGIKLAAGSIQKIVIEVNDNITGIDEFTAIGYGFDRLDTRGRGR